MLSAHYSCRILMKLEIFGRFSKTAQMSSFIKIRLMGAELFNADGQTDLKLIVVFAILRTRQKIKGVSLALCVCFKAHKS
jgi:hypothetical protein